MGTLFGGPHNKDCSILGSILGSPILGNYHFVCWWRVGNGKLNGSDIFMSIVKIMIINIIFFFWGGVRGCRQCRNTD